MHALEPIRRQVPKLAPLAMTIGTFLIWIGLTDAVAAGLAQHIHSHGHAGHLIVLFGMVSILAGVLVQAARPHRSIQGS